MPLCPQITITPVTVTSSGMTVSSVIAGGDAATTEQLGVVAADADAAYAAALAAQADAASAIADANTAIANANAALAQANIAYNEAIGSLQPSASTIVNASNQITAISANGITVYSGASATSGARVVMNSVGIAGYDSGGSATFSITASTGAAVFKGNIAGSSIIGSDLNINGACIIKPTGELIATNATITGSITATTGTFTGTVYASSGTFTGTVTATTGSFTGSIYAQSGYIGNATNGWNFSSSGYIYNNSMTTILYPSAATNPYVLISDRAISASKVQANSTASDAISTSGGFLSSGSSQLNTLEIVNTMSIFGGYGITSDWSPNVDGTNNVGQASKRWVRVYAVNSTISTSDVNKKTDITNSPLGLDFINSLRPVAFRWIVGNKSFVLDADGNPIQIGVDDNGKPIYEIVETPGKRLHYGFIAQEVKQAVDASGVQDFAGWVLDDLNDPNGGQSLSYEQFIAPMTKAIQELSERVTQLEGGH